jgi:ankyrin repeat protein
VVRGQLEAVRLLLDGGADPDLVASTDTTPLMSAAGMGQLGVLRLLLERGAEVDAVGQDAGATAFHIACTFNQPGCAEALARAGCDVGIKDLDGKTGRQLAVAEGHVAVVERLRAVVAEQLRAVQAAQAAGPEPELVEPPGPPPELVEQPRAPPELVEQCQLYAAARAMAEQQQPELEQQRLYAAAARDDDSICLNL